jgi:hypothetical protein
LSAGQDSTGSKVTILSSTSSVPHFAPADQPVSVRQITRRLFPAYTIDDGSVHLAGCSLEDRLFVRLSFDRVGSQVEIYVDEDGQAVPEEMVRRLGMTETRPLNSPPELVQSQVDQAVRSGTQLANRRWPEMSSSPPVATTLLWCKYVRGKLRFTLGDRAVDLPFEDWARSLQPPPFVCPWSGEKTYHLAATDDGRICAADQIEPCGETGRRVLREDLLTCSVTGRRVLRELAGICPLSGQPVLLDAMATCGTCGQRVSPAVLDGTQCSACRAPRPIGREDPRLARLFERRSDFGRWRRWRIAETANVYVFFASGWLKRLLVVVDKDSFDLKRVATAKRFATAWHEVDLD